MHGRRLDDRCRDCAGFYEIPYQYGDPMYGLCYEMRAWRYAGDRASEIGCESMRPRNKDNGGYYRCANAGGAEEI